jgi:alkylation response protein AidB-like acyl-CoA dehydrogenase
MSFELSQEQQLMQETFARFLNEESPMDRVRAALPSGFDQALWTGLAELGAFSLRVPQAAIYGGTSEIHRSMIAERALNLPRTRA